MMMMQMRNSKLFTHFNGARGKTFIRMATHAVLLCSLVLGTHASGRRLGPLHVKPGEDRYNTMIETITHELDMWNNDLRKNQEDPKHLKNIMTLLCGDENAWNAMSVEDMIRWYRNDKTTFIINDVPDLDLFFQERMYGDGYASPSIIRLIKIKCGREGDAKETGLWSLSRRSDEEKQLAKDIGIIRGRIARVHQSYTRVLKTRRRKPFANTEAVQSAKRPRAVQPRNSGNGRSRDGNVQRRVAGGIMGALIGFRR